MTARVRVAPGGILLGALVGAMVSGRFETAAGCLAIAAVTAIGVGARWPGRRWLGTLGFGLTVGALLNLYLTPGTPWTGWPVIAGRPATVEGGRFALLLTLRLLAGLVALRGLAAAWPGEAAVDLLLGPLARLGLPVGRWRTALGLALRLAPLVEAEGRRIAAIQDLKAGRPARGAWARLERRRAAVVPALTAALERAERVALALEARHVGLRPAGLASGVPRSAWGWSGWLITAAALAWR